LLQRANARKSALSNWKGVLKLTINQLTEEMLRKMLKSKGKANKTNPFSAVNGHRILTSAYVSQFNRGVSYRIRQHEASHATSIDSASKTRFR